MHVEGVGELTDRGTYWQLVYTDCQHVQVLARVGLESAARAERDIRRYYAYCRTCQLQQRRRAQRRREP